MNFHFAIESPLSSWLLFLLEIMFWKFVIWEKNLQSKQSTVKSHEPEASRKTKKGSS